MPIWASLLLILVAFIVGGLLVLHLAGNLFEDAFKGFWGRK